MRDCAPPARVDVIGVPMDLGADRRGVDMGPSAVRYARLREGLEALGIATLVDHGNLAVPVPESRAATGALAPPCAISSAATPATPTKANTSG